MVWNIGLDESQAGIKTAWRNINNLRYADDITLTAESKEELKSLLMNEKGEWKSWLKSQYSKNKDHGTSWQIKREKLETMTTFILGGSKITANGECSHEIKRCLFLGRKAMRNLHSIFKSRDITSLTKVHIVKAMVFPAVIYRYESWTIRKLSGEELFDAFKLWCWRRHFKVS